VKVPAVPKLMEVTDAFGAPITGPAGVDVQVYPTIAVVPGVTAQVVVNAIPEHKGDGIAKLGVKVACENVNKEINSKNKT